jgi:predicted RNA-binding Zn ribbon-like protein
MAKSKDKQPFFDLCADHVALDFINSLERFGRNGGKEWLQDYGDLLRFAEKTDLLAPQQIRRLAAESHSNAGARALRSAKELREAAANIFYGLLDGKSPNPADVTILEWHFHGVTQHRELRWRGDPAEDGHAKLEWSWGRSETDTNLPVWALAEQTLQLLMSDGIGQVKACGAETCRWLFLDSSKNHMRRWCNMTVCGNRMKARRFQARSK